MNNYDETLTELLGTIANMEFELLALETQFDDDMEDELSLEKLTAIKEAVSGAMALLLER